MPDLELFGVDFGAQETMDSVVSTSRPCEYHDRCRLFLFGTNNMTNHPRATRIGWEGGSKSCRSWNVTKNSNCKVAKNYDDVCSRYAQRGSYFLPRENNTNQWKTYQSIQTFGVLHSGIQCLRWHSNVQCPVFQTCNTCSYCWKQFYRACTVAETTLCIVKNSGKRCT